MSSTVTTITKSKEAEELILRLSTGQLARQAARDNTYNKSTSGLAPAYIQVNLLVLPSRYADDFRNLCARNPVPCPLVAESASPGDFSKLISHLPGVSAAQLVVVDGDGSGDNAKQLDLRTDCPQFNVYDGPKLVKAAVPDVVAEWQTNDHVAFLIGCSQSFESALVRDGIAVRHMEQDRTVSMYRTSIPLNAAGIFAGGHYVVSMRPFRRSELERVRDITRRYTHMHGEPIAWGWDAVARLGITDIDQVQWGDAPLTKDGRPLSAVSGDDEDNMPVFWGCGVTPQDAVMSAPLEGTILAHAPGRMLILDCREEDVL